MQNYKSFFKKHLDISSSNIHHARLSLCDLFFWPRRYVQKTNLVALALADVDFRGEDDALWPDLARHFRAPQQRLLEQWVPLLREELIEQLGTRSNAVNHLKQ
jgi:hypothetical protein